jgi:hypothetical protein
MRPAKAVPKPMDVIMKTTTIMSDERIISRSISMSREREAKTVRVSRKRMMTTIAEREKATWMHCIIQSIVSSPSPR